MQPFTSPTVDSVVTRRRCLIAGFTASAAAALTACGIPFTRSRSGRAASAAYERKAAGHLYQRYASRIYLGKLPAMLYAVGVLEISLSGNGQIQRLNWMRKPSHAPEVVQEIERLVRAAAPFPPTGVGAVTYTDTWLWDRSGRFQLDALSEGQLEGG